MSFNPFSDVRPLKDRSGNDVFRYRDVPPRDAAGKVILVTKIAMENERILAAKRLLDHMRDISGNPKGSAPEPYLKAKELEVLEKFLRLANAVGWAGSDEISMRTSRLPNARVQNGSATQAVKGGIALALATGQTGKKHRGYIFGSLNIPERQLVAICDDGELRSLRGRELYTGSFGKGWGLLPDTELMEPVLAPGASTGINTEIFRKPMTARFLDCIPNEAYFPKDKPVIDPRSFGL